ncbi:NUDIX hydrolase [Cognatishimia maritima]|uniref:NUDIX domain-containing protein n=1 Tax=Cognatishimia maritima TaxID=870908 RepID=A0A1M5VEW8_9RHOB|nr:NUDIX hydrolase [Cognatishimia maritima]SHH73715.1 NUDIX domain-containing protein [Cognatishimia maritima]
MAAEQLPIKLKRAAKRDIRTQFGALIYRRKEGKIQILLISSRGTGRWIIPKGWPMLGKRPAEAAAQEAWEEAGVKGEVSDQSVGVYTYMKTGTKFGTLPCLVNVYPVKARKLLKSFPEASQRKRKWVSQKKAAKLVKERELSRLISSFDPRHY